MSSTTNFDSELTKAQIHVHDQNGIRQESSPIHVLFNPQQYTVDKSNQFANIAIPGRQSPIIQFVRGESETLSIELFFDTYTYKEGEDVRIYTQKITGLLNIDADIHAPPVCTLVWGKAGEKTPYFTGIIEKATTTYTMFLSDGTPVRAKMNLSFRQFQSLDNKEVKLKSSDKTKRVVVKSSDPLWMIASREYNDPSKWRIIAEANGINDPMKLKPGSEIIIPALD